MSVLRKWKISLYKRFLNFGVISPKVVVQMDGGICSQMHQYLIGTFFLRRGYRVSYDLSFFDEWGMDLENKYVRNFDLLKIFPYLTFEKASKTEVAVYRRKHYTLGNHSLETMTDYSFLERTPPVFLGGYYSLAPKVWSSAFKSLYHIDNKVLDAENNAMLDQINSSLYSVAVHVRRGDLKEEVYAYGKPASLGYFQRSIAYFKDRMGQAFFYFFSDEPEWVIDELIPALGLGPVNSLVVDINGSDKGYMDLCLIACCKNQITSKGTLGKYGALLNDNLSKIVILCDDRTEYYWKDVFDHPVYL